MARTIAAAVAAVAVSGPLLAAEPPEDGKALSVRWCASCHVVEANRAGTDAVPTFQAIADRPGTSAASLKAYLVKPHGQMPDFQLAFPHIDAISAYILGLASPRP
jgi:mono/diheme cytochrome c family protein